ncbi:MAG: DNA primase [Cytophagales bacterium]|nr:DNA primase [Cytophagales bacterium]
MRLTDSCVQEIKSSADIVEVVSDFVSLKKRGANFVALSPFTNEKSPSFYVSPSKQIFKCFSTSKGGDAVTFLMEIDKLSYVEALKYLAKKYNITLQYDRPATEQEVIEYSERDALYIVLEYAKEFYKYHLHHHPEGMSIAMPYFIERGLHAKTITDFELGYATDSWSHFMDEAIAKQYSMAHLEKAGLVKVSETGKKFDFFRNRVMFPIHNASGKTVALAGRIMGSDKGTAKYINSPETELYHKSEILYGLYQAKQSIRTADECYLVEGYMDVLSMHQAGVQNVVASSGTSLTEEQVRLLSRYTKNVTILYDGDKAGINAAMRGTDMLLQTGLNIKVVLFPDGNDPDSYAQQVGAEAFAEYIRKSATDFITFKAKMLLKNAEEDPIKLADATKEIVQSIAKIDDLIQRQVYVKHCATLMHLDEKTIASAVDNMRFKNYKETIIDAEKNVLDSVIKTSIATQPPTSAYNTSEYAEKEIIRILIEHSTENFDDDTTFYHEIFRHTTNFHFENAYCEKIIQLFHQQLVAGTVPGLDYFLSHPDKEIEAQLVDILNHRYQVSLQWYNKYSIWVPEKDAYKVELLTQSLARLNFEKLKKQSENIVQELKNIPIENIEDTNSKLETIESLKSHQRKYAEVLHMVVSA